MAEADEKYNPEQQKALESVRKLTDELAEVEDLEKQRHRPVYGLDGAMDQAMADISLDHHAPYHVLEERLRGAITKARELGLARDPLVEKIEILAFS